MANETPLPEILEAMHRAGIAPASYYSKNMPLKYYGCEGGCHLFAWSIEGEWVDIPYVEMAIEAVLLKWCNDNNIKINPEGKEYSAISVILWSGWEKISDGHPTQLAAAHAALLAHLESEGKS